jgi:23S rRNA pseudouridine2605 synthase
VAKLGDSADPGVDDIRVDGERLARERPTYWILNKPRGVVTTLRDEAGRKTVINLLPDGLQRVYPVGRLDKETSGLLLLTNDGDTAHALLHPSLRNEREYKVNVKGLIDLKAVGRLEKGIILEDGRTSPGQVRQVRQDAEAGTSNFLLTLGEGKKRQIRRSLLILGFPVRRLVRVRMGPLRLGRLAVGDSRPLRSDERRSLLEHVEKLRAAKDNPDLARKPTSARGLSRAGPQRTARSK